MANPDLCAMNSAKHPDQLSVSTLWHGESDLRRDEMLFRSVFEQSAVGIAITDSSYRFIRVNASFARMLGRTIDEVHALTILDVTHPDDLDRTFDSFRRQELQPFSLTYEKRYIRADGSTVWGRASVTRLRNADGALDGYLGVVEDITERKEATRRLEHQSELLQTIMDNLPVMVALFDVDGRCLFVNGEWQKTLGWSVGEVMGTEMLELALSSDTDARRAHKVIADGAGEWTDFEPKAKDGRTVPSAWACVKLSDGTRMTIGKSNAERRAMEQRLVQSQRMEALGQLAGGVAHDFNNILMVISACAEFIRLASRDNARILSDVREIEQAAERAAGLTRQLLAFSRRQILQPEIVDVNSALHALTKTLNRLIGEGVELAILPRVADAHVEVDRHQLEQVFLNLVVNARDATQGSGTITIETNVEAGGRREFVVIKVSDDGEGMPASVRDRIFEPFFTTKAVGKGTGLGLATVLGIVEQSGGTIGVESELGRGTVFTIRLPRAQCPAGSAEPSVALEPSHGTETVLVAEDEGAVRELVRRVLSGLGYRVLQARHGADALALVKDCACHIDLLVTDVVMPEMDGRALARELRRARPELPVLFMSGYTDDELLRRGALDDFAQLVRKPFQSFELAHAVRRLLDRA